MFFLIGEFPNKTDGMVWLQTNRQTKHICIYRNSILVTVCTQPLYLCIQKVERKLSRCT